MVSVKELKAISSGISILYVEDDIDLQRSVTHYLKIIFDRVEIAPNGKIALEALQKQEYDIIITDIQMPIMNGLEMIKIIREDRPKQEILITTAFSEADYMIEAISLNVNGYILKPMDFDKINLTLYKSVKGIALERENEEYKTDLEAIVEKRTKENTILEKEKVENYEQTLLSLVELVEKRDAYTAGHSIRVATYSKAIGREMGYDEESCELLYRAGILHDIGKIETPDAVLLKPGKLDELEYSLIKEHATTGYNLLKKIPMYKEISNIIMSHHERYDGTGYPQGLKNDAIPKLTRIMIVADAFDAMTTNRIYKARMSVDSAIKELNACTGTQFDAEVVKAAIKCLKSVVVDEEITQLPSNQMQDKRFAYFFEDQITQAYNPSYLELFLLKSANSSKRYYINILCLHNFGVFNTTYGWDEGNTFLKRVVEILSASYESASIFRIHGDDFVLICDKEIQIDTALFEALFKKYKDIVTTSQQKFNSDQHKISSLSELEELLNQNA